MKEHEGFVRIEPAAVDLSRGSHEARPAQRGGRRLGAAVLVAGLMALLVAVFVVLPGLVERTPALAPPAAKSQAQPVAGAANSALVEAPKPALAESERIKLRSAAQAALERIKELEPAVVSKGVERWAAQELAAARAQTAAGDSAYATLDYAGALSAYQAAMAAIEGLLARAEQVLAEALKAGTAALDAGNAAAARAAFERALAIDPAHAAASRGLERAATLDEVRALVAQAEEHEQGERLVEARAAYAKALQIDPETTAAREAVQRLDAALREREFTDAMSRAYAALERRDDQAARAAFARAAKLKPQATEPAAAIAEIDRRALDGKLEALIAQARELEAKEEWWAAVVRYDEALKIDSALAAARDGIARAKPRADLDVKLQQAIEHPERLTDGEVRAKAIALQQQAATLAHSGPRLRQQLAVLDTLLKQSVTALEVRLVSDEATEVEVYRVGKLGRFREKTVSILPGRYVAVGNRTGFRDVRVEFTVAHGSAIAPVIVRCEQKIAFGGR